MKEKVKTEDIIVFKRQGNIFSILLLLTILLPVPLLAFIGYAGLGIWGLLAIVTMYYAIRVEKLKKNFNIQTYREILAFLEEKNMDELEKNQEYGKRSYQKFLLAIGSGLLTIVVAVIMGWILLKK